MCEIRAAVCANDADGEFTAIGVIADPKVERGGEAVRVEEIAGRSVKVIFQITKEADGKAVAKGWLDYVLVSLENGRPQTIPEDIVAIYSV